MLRHDLHEGANLRSDNPEVAGSNPASLLEKPRKRGFSVVLVEIGGPNSAQLLPQRDALVLSGSVLQGAKARERRETVYNLDSSDLCDLTRGLRRA
jgi:hypothetical protein